MDIIKLKSLNDRLLEAFLELSSFLDYLALMELSYSNELISSYSLNFYLKDYREKEKNIFYDESVIELVVTNPGRLFDFIFSEFSDFKERDKIMQKIPNLQDSFIHSNFRVNFQTYMLYSNGIPQESEIFLALNTNKCAFEVVNYPILLEEISILESSIDYAYSSDESKNLTNYSDMLLKICKTSSDGIILFFSSYDLLQDYISLWNLNSKECTIFQNILTYKLIFIEDTSNNYTVISDYKNSIDSGRGAILLLSIRNELIDMIMGELKGVYSKAILFFGFPFDTRIENKFTLSKLKMFKYLYQISEEDYLYHDAYNLINRIITGSIEDILDKKFLLFLNEKLLSSPNSEKGFSEWLHKRLEIDNGNNYIEERIKNININN